MRYPFYLKESWASERVSDLSGIPQLVNGKAGRKSQVCLIRSQSSLSPILNLASSLGWSSTWGQHISIYLVNLHEDGASLNLQLWPGLHKSKRLWGLPAAGPGPKTPWSPPGGQPQQTLLTIPWKNPKVYCLHMWSESGLRAGSLGWAQGRDGTDWAWSDSREMLWALLPSKELDHPIQTTREISQSSWWPFLIASATQKIRILLVTAHSSAFVCKVHKVDKTSFWNCRDHNGTLECNS